MRSSLMPGLNLPRELKTEISVPDQSPTDVRNRRHARATRFMDAELGSKLMFTRPRLSDASPKEFQRRDHCAAAFRHRTTG